jgi:hypothetical protein
MATEASIYARGSRRSKAQEYTEDLWLVGKSKLAPVLWKANKQPSSRSATRTKRSKMGRPCLAKAFSPQCDLSLFLSPCRVPFTFRAFVQNSRFYHRRLVFGIVYVVVYGLLDRTTVYLQIWPSISAWYPPIGLSVALRAGTGPAIIPVKPLTP